MNEKSAATAHVNVVFCFYFFFIFLAEINYSKAGIFQFISGILADDINCNMNESL